MRLKMDESLYRSWEILNAELVTCRRCPRLVEWRETVAKEKRRAFREWDYWGKPVLGFGDPNASLIILGLAPAAHGANRTGRMFTGDSSGNTLAAAMHRAGYANQVSSEHRGDGLVLRDAFITAVARCAPPGNRPKAIELANCRPYLAAELKLLHTTRVVLALGRIAFDGYVRLRREETSFSSVVFKHGAWYTFDPPFPALVACYHPSRQNTQTGRLTEEMLDQVFERVRMLLDEN
jgi:uracil-DNA glycosylase family 4